MTDPIKVELVQLEAIHRDPANARTHPPEQIEQLQKSIRQFGFTVPIVLDDQRVCRAGNGRIQAVEALYRHGETIYLPPGSEAGGHPIPFGAIPAVSSAGWTPEQRRAYAIADNQIAANAGWDEALKRDIIESLPETFDFSAIGLNEAALKKLLADEGRQLKVFELNAKPVADRFWITVRGPLAQQAEALQRIKELMAEMEGVEVKLGTTQVDV